APVTTPITAAGNALAVLGGSTVTGAGIPSGTAPAAATPGDAVTGGNGAVLGGTPVVAPVTAPMTAGGNALAVLGTSAVTGGGPTSPAIPATPIGAVTAGDGSLLGGLQLLLPVTAPISLGGNAIALLGDSTVTATPGTDPGTDPGTGP